MAHWFKPLSIKQANPSCGCVWSITGGYLLFTCNAHTPKSELKRKARERAAKIRAARLA